MKKTDLERHLRKHGCLFLEEGSKHTKKVRLSQKKIKKEKTGKLCDIMRRPGKFA